jgi:hypothetical protein
MTARAALIFAGTILLHAAEALPPELAQKLDLTRMLPPSIAASRMMDYLEKANISREQKTALSLEAYLQATSFGAEAPLAYAVRQRGGPLGWLLRRSASAAVIHPMGAAMRAWQMYQANFDPGENKRLEFPARRIPKNESCRVVTVDDPYDYYDAAIKAGPKVFSEVLPAARYAIDLGRLSRAILAMPTRDRPTRLISDLLLLQSSDRQFSYAMEFTPLHLSVLKLASESGLYAARLLMERYSGFLMRHWTQARCSGNEWTSYRGIVEEYNATAADLESKFEELKLPRLRPEAWWAKAIDPSSYSELDADIWNLTMLRLKIDGAAIDDVNAASVLREVEDFRPPDKLAPSQRLLQHHFAYHELLVKFRDTQWERGMMVSWLRQLANGRLYREAPLVWWAVLRDAQEWAGKNPQRRAMLESSGDTAMQAWTKLDTLDGKY